MGVFDPNMPPGLVDTEKKELSTCHEPAQLSVCGKSGPECLVEWGGGAIAMPKYAQISLRWVFPKSVGRFL